MSRKSALKEMIITKALDKFRLHGFRRVSMSEIARDMRISKKTLYNHFSGKEALVSACVDRNIQSIIPQVTSALTSDGPVSERLYATWKALLQVPDLVSEEMMEDVRTEYPHLWETIQEKKNAVLGHFEKIIADGIRTGEVRKGIQPKVAVRTIMAVSNAILTPQTILNENFSIAETVTTVGTMIMNGIFNNPPDMNGRE